MSKINLKVFDADKSLEKLRENFPITLTYGLEGRWNRNSKILGRAVTIFMRNS